MVLLAPVVLAEDRIHDNGKPGASRGRKATGPSRSAGLPNELERAMPSPVLELRPVGSADELLPLPDVLPVDPPRSHASGPAPYRILAVGGRLLAGHGVTTHDLALTGAVARGFARLTGHGADVEAAVVPRPDAAGLAKELRRRDLTRIDALVLVLGSQDGFVRSLDAARRFNRLLMEAARSMVPAASITVVLPPSAARIQDAPAFEEVLREGAAGLTRIVQLSRPALGSGPRARYAVWGAAIAEAVAAGAVEPIVWTDPVDELDERKRAAAVRRLAPFDADWEAPLQTLVEHVAHAYGAASAAVTVVQGDRALYLAGHAVRDRSLVRAETLCDTAMRTYGGVIVGDAQDDERFHRLPSVTSGDVRFYAGHRIESPEGQPLGVLCVWDPEPRTVRGQDLALLRDFALIAERRIRERASRSVA